MKIETGKYHVAPLTSSAKAVEIIKEAEKALQSAVGSEIMLIAYEKEIDA